MPTTAPVRTHRGRFATPRQERQPGGPGRSDKLRRVLFACLRAKPSGRRTRRSSSGEALRRPDALGGRPIFIGRRRGSSAAGRDDPRRRPPQARQTILAPSGPAAPRASSDGQRGDAEDDRRARCGAAGPQEDRQVDPDDPPHPERRRCRLALVPELRRSRVALVPEHRHSEHRHVVSARSLLGNSAEPSRWC